MKMKGKQGREMVNWMNERLDGWIIGRKGNKFERGFYTMIAWTRKWQQIFTYEIGYFLQKNVHQEI